MAEIDTAAEWRRLQELYRDISEEQLEAIAARGYELTDIAKQALHSEVSRRNLKVNVRLERPIEEDVEQSGDPEFDPATLDLVSVGVVETRAQAKWIKKMLNDAGIPCYFGPNLLENVEPLEFVPSQDIDIKVLRNDGNRVAAIRNMLWEKFPPPEDNQPLDLEVHCPNCHSTEVVFEGFASNVPQPEEGPEDAENIDQDEDSEEEPEDVEQVRAADPDPKFHWRCDSCGHEWEDEGLES